MPERESDSAGPVAEQTGTGRGNLQTTRGSGTGFALGFCLGFCLGHDLIGG